MQSYACPQKSVKRVLLVGGATRMCKVRELLKEYFGFEPDTGIDADEAVMHGAAIEAARLSSAGDPKADVKV